jgi:hypothetical protein
MPLSQSFGEWDMSKQSIGFVVCMLSMFIFCMALVFGPAVMEGHHVLAILLLSMFGIGINSVKRARG